MRSTGRFWKKKSLKHNDKKTSKKFLDKHKKNYSKKTRKYVKKGTKKNFSNKNLICGWKKQNTKIKIFAKQQLYG